MIWGRGCARRIDPPIACRVMSSPSMESVFARRVR
jgi:hypothetical protein